MGVEWPAMEITSPDRVLFPDDGFTKATIVAYYESAAPVMIRHLAGRPLTLERFPRGIDGGGFMQKNAGAHFPASIERISVPKRGGTTTYAVVHEAADIPYLANQGTIAFHVWPSRVPDLWRMDRIVIDLDPPAGETEAAREAAAIAGRALGDLGLPAMPMTTGSKGYHVVSPIIPTIEPRRLATAMQGFSLLLAARHPELLTTEFRKVNRSGRVFVDWLRNSPASTSVCPWSLRPNLRAPVAMPITWEELTHVTPDAFNLGNIGERFGVPDPLDTLQSDPSDAALAVAAIERRLTTAGITPRPFDRFRS